MKKINKKARVFYITLFLSIFVLIIAVLLQKVEFFEQKKGFNYLWSKRVNYFGPYNEIQSEQKSDYRTIEKEVKGAKDVLYIRNTGNRNPAVKTDLSHLYDLLKYIKEPIILVTADGVRSVPSSYDKGLVNKLLSSPKIKRWLTQNYDRTLEHYKLGYYPIGLDMHTTKFYPNNVKTPDEKWQYYLKIRRKNSKNKKKNIFCDSHLSITNKRRKEMYDILKNNKLIDFLPKRISGGEIMEKYSSYRYVLSPVGNGLDCHRTWEIILLGSVPVLESSSLDDMFLNNNLPVMVVDDYSKLNNMSHSELDNWWKANEDKMSDKNILEKFEVEYWLK